MINVSEWFSERHRMHRASVSAGLCKPRGVVCAIKHIAMRVGTLRFVTVLALTLLPVELVNTFSRAKGLAKIQAKKAYAA